MKKDVKLSITVPIYNHEKYLEHAIDSILMQKVNFTYEVLVGEDCSTDSSRAILQKYKQYEQIHIYEREKNMQSSRIRNDLDLKLRTKGEYIITLEGDDYWTDPNKLQQQVDFLDSHPDYYTCGHKFVIVNENEEEYYDEDIKCQFYEDNPYDITVFEKGMMLSHANTLMFRNFYPELSEKKLSFFTDYRYIGGDYLLTAYLVLQGKVYCIPKVMSAYRKVVSNDSSSYSSDMERNNARDNLYSDILGAETLLNEQYNISFDARKKSAFASAVFKWNRERTKKNFKVVVNIILSSGHHIQYSIWLIYLLGMRFVKNILGKRQERVKF